MFQLAAGLARRGHRVVVVSRPGGDLPDACRDAGVEFIALPLRHSFDVGSARRLARLFSAPRGRARARAQRDRARRRAARDVRFRSAAGPRGQPRGFLSPGPLQSAQVPRPSRRRGRRLGADPRRARLFGRAGPGQDPRRLRRRGHGAVRPAARGPDGGAPRVGGRRRRGPRRAGRRPRLEGLARSARSHAPARGALPGRAHGDRRLPRRGGEGAHRGGRAGDGDRQTGS